MSGIESLHSLDLANSSATTGGGTPRRYSGRAVARPALPPRERATPPRPLSPLTVDGGAVRGGEHRAIPRRIRPAVVPWSVRLVIAISLVGIILVLWRSLGLLTPPIGAPTGIEATYAAGVNVLAGRVGAPLEPVRFMPPPAPWYGDAPVNPAAALPVYTWLATGLHLLLGEGQWPGRVLSIAFSLLAGFALFALVRRSAGARAGIYALLLYSVAPLSIVLGQQYSPASLVLAAQAGAMLALVRWRSTVKQDAPNGSTPAFISAVAIGALYALLDPGALWLAIPAAYVFIAPPGGSNVDTGPLSLRTIRRAQANAPRLPDLWQKSPNRGRLLTYAGAMLASSLVWWALAQAGVQGISLGPEHGGGGLAGAVGAIFNGGSYVMIIGILVERVLTIAGLLLLAAGILHGARPPLPLVFHVWLAGGALHALLDASRLPGHEDVLIPLILPACALAGVGAAWVGALPARLWLAITEQRRERDADYTISPHTAWLLDLPEERNTERPSRPQAQLALGKSVAQRSQTQSMRLRRAWWLAFGHFGLLAILAVIVVGSTPTTLARLQPNATSRLLSAVGAEVATELPADARLIIAGPHAPELFFATGKTGWAIDSEQFNLADVQRLQREGAAYLLSVDQDWLGKHPEYRGLITTYGVARLSRDYILFNLNSKPEGNDRLYFLESGHTLGGHFRAFWEQHEGVAKLGYPISEELMERNPLDGQERKVQYFERAVLEYHPEHEGTKDVVMLASVGLWVTQGMQLPRAEPIESTADKWYFAETGHIVKEAFLRYWQHQGGLAAFGYPISEEMPEISSADGKVYTVQYFEKARFEWHPTYAGTPTEVQLGLIGKQALEMPR